MKPQIYKNKIHKCSSSSFFRRSVEIINVMWTWQCVWHTKLVARVEFFLSAFFFRIDGAHPLGFLNWWIYNFFLSLFDIVLFHPARPYFYIFICIYYIVRTYIECYSCILVNYWLTHASNTLIFRRACEDVCVCVDVCKGKKLHAINKVLLFVRTYLHIFFSHY